MKTHGMSTAYADSVSNALPVAWNEQPCTAAVRSCHSVPAHYVSSSSASTCSHRSIVGLPPAGGHVDVDVGHGKYNRPASAKPPA